MGWNISLAAIDADVAAQIPWWLDLVASAEEPDGTVPLGQACGAEYRNTHYGVGKLGKLTLVTMPRVADYDAQWKKLSKSGRVVALQLSDNHEALAALRPGLVVHTEWRPLLQE